MVESFKVFEEFHNAKVVFSQKALNMGHEIWYEDCRRWVTTRFSEAVLSFLDKNEEEEEAKREPILLESTIIKGLLGSERVEVEVSSLPTIDILILMMTPLSVAPLGPSEARCTKLSQLSG